MTAQVIEFPTRNTDDTPTCHHCVHARQGQTTFCTLVSETILTEAATAAECPDYEQESS